MNFKKLAGKYESLFSNRITRRKSLPLSYASLFLAILIFITGTVSWFTVHDTAKIDSTNLKFEASTGLRVNDGEDLTNHLKLENFKLEEASSVDGRNFFFPTTGTFVSQTELMKFREGNVGDKNQKYAYKDFTLSGQKGTTVYIKNYTITVGDETFDGSTEIEYDANTGLPSAQKKHKKCPVRVAFISDSSETPVLFDPAALIDNYSMTCNAVSNSNSSGSPSLQQSVPQSFGHYYFVTGSPMYTIQDDPIDVTMVVWLEGTGENWEAYAGKQISVDVELESNWADMETIRLVDDTIGDTETYHPWITDKFQDADPIVIMSYKDTRANNKEKFVVMSFKGAIADKSGSPGTKLNCWEAPIPNYVTTDIAFYRYNPKQEEIFNAWYTKKGVNDLLNPEIKTLSDWIPKYGNLQESRVINGERQLVYTAVRGNKYGDTQVESQRLSPGLGYWGYVAGQTAGGGSTGGGSTGGGSGTTGKAELNIDFDVNDTINGKITSGYELYVVINGTDEFPLTANGYNRYSAKQLSVNKGSNITKFVLRNSENKEEFIPLDSAYSVMSSINYTFTMKDNGSAHGQS